MQSKWPNCLRPSKLRVVDNCGDDGGGFYDSCHVPRLFQNHSFNVITAANKNNSGSHEDDLLEREADKSTEYYCSIDYIPHVPTISTGM